MSGRCAHDSAGQHHLDLVIGVAELGQDAASLRAGDIGGAEGANIAFGAHDAAVAAIWTQPGRASILDEAQLLGPWRVEDVGGVGTLVCLHACDARGGEVAFARVRALLREDRFELPAEFGIVFCAPRRC